jgi:CRISPR-associated protein Cmr5
MTVRDMDAATRNAYVSYLEGLPATIVSVGLGQTVAMLLARGNGGEKGDGSAKAYKLLVEHLEKWLCDGWLEGGYRTQLPTNGRHGLALMAQITQSDQAAYALARAEALAYLDWLKKLGVGLLKDL